MHTSEWLELAKKVPCGQSRRHYHGAESRPNLIVFNNPDSWSAYCHSCKTSGIIKKQYMQKVDEVAPLYRKYLNRKATIPLRQLALMHPHKHKVLVSLLHEKGVSTTILEPLVLGYCLTDDRLVMGLNGVLVGRDVTERSNAKWLRYATDTPDQHLYLQGTFRHHGREPVILCEDLFSTLKLHHYTGKSCLWLGGTRLDDAALMLLIKHNAEVLIATDGDDAGDAAACMIKQRCTLFGLPTQHIAIPRGYDPKDLKPNIIMELFNV